MGNISPWPFYIWPMSWEFLNGYNFWRRIFHNTWTYWNYCQFFAFCQDKSWIFSAFVWYCHIIQQFHGLARKNFFYFLSSRPRLKFFWIKRIAFNYDYPILNGFKISFTENSIMFPNLKACLQISSSGCDNVDGIGLTLLLNIVMKAGQHSLKTFEGI